MEAMDVCDRMGGYLAEIQTQEQAELIVSILIKIKNLVIVNMQASIAMVEESLTGVGSWWIGLTDMSHEGR